MTTTASNDNSTPNRIRNAFRDDAIKAAQYYSALPANQQTGEAFRATKQAAQPYMDFLAVAELLRPVDLSVNDAALATPENNNGIGLDYRHDVRPDVDEMITAYSDGLRHFVRRNPRGDIERFAGGRTQDNAVTIGGYSTIAAKSGTRRGRFYGLHFHKGKLECFGQNGRRELACEEQSDPRGPDADNDNYVIERRETTCMPGAPAALGEIERERTTRRVLAQLGPERVALLRTVLQADNFAEVAEASGQTETSHNGRRQAVKILLEARNMMDA